MHPYPELCGQQPEEQEREVLGPGSDQDFCSGVPLEDLCIAAVEYHTP